MRILCSSNMPYADEAFSTIGEVSLKDGRQITAEDVAAADMLAVRSTTQVNESLLKNSPVRFVGTATIGIDHLEIPYLDKQGIEWVSSAGCNSTAVAEYITAALLELAVEYKRSLSDMTLGVVGVGHVGTKVAAQGRALGMNVLLNDPPRARVEGERGFCSLDGLLAGSDVVTTHVPWTREGVDATHHLAGKTFFESMKEGSWFMNAARGAIVDTEALKDTLLQEHLQAVVLDTWEGEPLIDKELQDLVSIATPHIAGYSLEGKVNGTEMVYQAACRFCAIEPSWFLKEHLPEPGVPELTVPEAGADPQLELLKIVRKIYDIRQDDRRLWDTQDLPDAERGNAFDDLRRNYPIRREFRFTKVSGDPDMVSTLQQLGFA